MKKGIKMSEDKMKKTKKSQTFYFLKGLKPGIIFNPKKNKVLVKATKGLFITKSKKISSVLTEKGYRQLSEKEVLTLRKKG